MTVNKVRKLRIFLSLILVAAVVYSPSLSGDFLFDDKILIVDNDFIKHLKTIPNLFTSHVFEFSAYNMDMGYNYYRPMQNLLSAFDYAVWKLNPFGYRLTNLLMHVLCCYLIFWMLMRFFRNFPLALLSSLFFCVNPIQTESVSYISGRSELLVSLFTLLTAVFYIKHIDTSGGAQTPPFKAGKECAILSNNPEQTAVFRQWYRRIDSRKGLFYFLSMLSFALAFLSREAGFLILMPFLILGYGMKSGLKKDSLIMHFIGFFGLLLIYIVLRTTILQPIRSVPKSPFNFFSDIINFINVLIAYIGLFIFPLDLHILRNIQPTVNFNFVKIFPALIFVLGSSVFLWWSAVKKHYPALFGALWYFIISSYLIKSIYKFSGFVITMEEHWIYLASAGFFIVLAYLTLRLKKAAATVISALIIFSWSLISMSVNTNWRNELPFYRYNLKFLNPRMGLIPRLNYMVLLTENGLYSEAIKEGKKALSADPLNFVAYIQIGDAYKGMGEFSEAKAAYKKATQIDSFCWQAYRKLKRLSEETGEKYEEDLDPNFSPVERQLVGLLRLGEFDKALEILERELAVSPSPQLYTLAGITLGKLGLYSRAMIAFEAALKLDPDFIPALSNLAVVYERHQEPEKAQETRNKITSLYNQKK